MSVLKIKDDTGTWQSVTVIKGEDGADGKSAYQIALDNGFEGTEQEWLDSLKSTEVEVDLSNYYTKTEVDEVISNVDVNVDLSDYATKDYVIEEINTKINDLPTGGEDVDLSDYATIDYVDQKVGSVKYPIDGYVRKEVQVEGTEVNSLNGMPAIKTYAGGTTLTFDKETTIRIYTGETQDGYFDQAKYVEYTGTTITIPDTEDGYLTDYIIVDPITSEEFEDPNIFSLKSYTSDYDGLSELANINPPVGTTYPSVFGVSNMDANTLRENGLMYEDEGFDIASDLFNKGYRLFATNSERFKVISGNATVSPNTIEGAFENDSVFTGTPYEQLPKVHTMGLGVYIDDFSKFVKNSNTDGYGAWNWTYDDDSPTGVGSDGKYHYVYGCYSAKAENLNGNRLLYVCLPPGETYTIECLTSKIGWMNINTSTCKKWGMKDIQVRKNVIKYLDYAEGSNYYWDIYDEDKIDEYGDGRTTLKLYDELGYMPYCTYPTTDDETGDEGGYLTITNTHSSSKEYNWIALGVADYSCVNDIKIVKGTVPYSQLTGDTGKKYVNIKSSATSDTTLGETYTITFRLDDDVENDYARYSDNAILKYIDVDNNSSSGGGTSTGGSGYQLAYNTEILTDKKWIDGRPIYLYITTREPYTTTGTSNMVNQITYLYDVLGVSKGDVEMVDLESTFVKNNGQSFKNTALDWYNYVSATSASTLKDQILNYMMYETGYTAFNPSGSVFVVRGKNLSAETTVYLYMYYVKASDI